MKEEISEKKEVKPKYYSDFWREKFSQYDYYKTANTDTTYTLRKCLYDVSRIVNIYDSSLQLAYNDGSKENEIDSNTPTIYLNPELALDPKLEMGEKIDIFAGQILLNSAVSKNVDDKDLYYQQMQDFKGKNNLKKQAKSALYLASENYLAKQLIASDAPGYVSYCEARTEYIVKSEEKSAKENIKTKVKNDTLENIDKVSLTIREFDTLFGSKICNYGDFQNEIDELKELLINEPKTNSRLEIISDFVNKYLDDEKENKASQQQIEGSLLSKKEFNPGANKPSTNAVIESSNLSEKRDMKKILDKRILDGCVPDIQTKIEEMPAGDETKYSGIVQGHLPLIEAIKEQIQFVNTNHLSWEEYALRSGELDEGNLHQLIQKSDRVFYQVETFTKPEVQIAILVDESGSMGEQRRFEKAKKLTISLVEAIKDIKGIDLYVFGHSGEGLDCELYQYVTPDDKNHTSLIRIEARQQNYDSFAILETGAIMLKQSKNYSRKIIFVLSDGSPCGDYDYHGIGAETHIRSSCEYLKEDAGIEVYGIGIDNAYTQAYSEKLFGANNGIVLSNFNIGEVSNIIATFLSGIIKER